MVKFKFEVKQNMKVFYEQLDSLRKTEVFVCSDHY
jgi:hypothetical protein